MAWSEWKKFGSDLENATFSNSAHNNDNPKYLDVSIPNNDCYIVYMFTQAAGNNTASLGKNNAVSFSEPSCVAIYELKKDYNVSGMAHCKNLSGKTVRVNINFSSYRGAIGIVTP